MSQFSTGELAKAAEVSVRTVQYYDQRGILTPSEVTEGGRRIYHESDLERLQVTSYGKSKIMASFAVENVWECHSNLPSLSDGPTGCHLLF